MAIGYLIVGTISGICSVIFLLISGGSLWDALVVYLVVSTASGLLLVLCVWLYRPRRKDRSVSTRETHPAGASNR